MQLVFSSKAWEEYLWWSETDSQATDRINLLIQEMLRSPFGGIGKPEPLKHSLHGWWSRRIDAQHRIVYKIVGDQIWILQMRYHY